MSEAVMVVTTRQSLTRLSNHRAWIVAALLTGFTGESGAAEATAPHDEAGRRLYVTGIVGSSLGGDGGPQKVGWIGDVASPTVGGDAAIGVAIDRPRGTTRIEFEGRTRPRAGVAEAAHVDSTKTVDTTEWSTLANIWRDVTITEHVGAYAGAGIGVGGVRDATAEPATAFTWQIGGGVTYALNDRITFDVGYRALPAAFAGLSADKPAVGPTGELLLSIRFYDPLRGWGR